MIQKEEVWLSFLSFASYTFRLELFFMFSNVSVSFDQKIILKLNCFVIISNV